MTGCQRSRKTRGHGQNSTAKFAQAVPHGPRNNVELTEFQWHLKNSINSKDRGVKQAGFHVLVGASMPNVLIEVGFLSNKQESKKLENSKYRKVLATAIFKAIEEFVAINNNIITIFFITICLVLFWLMFFGTLQVYSLE